MERAHSPLRTSGVGGVFAASLTTLLMQIPAAVLAQEDPVATVEFTNAGGRFMASVSVFPGALDTVLSPQTEVAVLDYLSNRGYRFRPLGANFFGTTHAGCESTANDVWGNLFSTDDRSLLTELELDSFDQVIFSIYRHNCSQTGGEGVLLLALIGPTSPHPANLSFGYLSWTPSRGPPAGVDPFGESGSAAAGVTDTAADSVGLTQTRNRSRIWGSLADNGHYACICP